MTLEILIQIFLFGIALAMDAFAVSVTAFQCGKSALPIGTSTGNTNGRKRSEPRTFESVCASAVRFAAAEPPIAASQPVTVVPMFAPKRTAIPIS